MQVVALHIADHLTIQVQLVQVTAAVVQVVDLAAVWQGQCSQITERIVLITERAVGGDFLR
ncbi:hypothetical protein D3C77_787490 [compost metagenome]